MSEKQSSDVLSFIVGTIGFLTVIFGIIAIGEAIRFELGFSSGYAGGACVSVGVRYLLAGIKGEEP